MFDRGEQEVPVNGLVTQVGPEDHLLVEVGIQRHRVPLLLHQLGVLLPLQAQAANVTAVGEHQARLLACRQNPRGDWWTFTFGNVLKNTGRQRTGKNPGHSYRFSVL